MKNIDKSVFIPETKKTYWPALDLTQKSQSKKHTHKECICNGSCTASGDRVTPLPLLLRHSTPLRTAAAATS